ncbi:MAG: hypothetical protein BYD32DRAFT_406692 [Podila humilis]|nr:MAG: hypothetical protein BYD32DRAFT_406692 [Podila humilis]
MLKRTLSEVWHFCILVHNGDSVNHSLNKRLGCNREWNVLQLMLGDTGLARAWGWRGNAPDTHVECSL